SATTSASWPFCSRTSRRSEPMHRSSATSRRSAGTVRRAILRRGRRASATNASLSEWRMRSRRSRNRSSPNADRVTTDVHRAIDAVWRIESAKLIAGLTRIVRDVGLAEDLAQDALVAALDQWPESGVPNNPGAWLMQTAKRRAI